MGCWPFSEHLGGHVEDGPVVYRANAFNSRLRGDLVLLGSSPTKSTKKKDPKKLKYSPVQRDEVWETENPTRLPRNCRHGWCHAPKPKVADVIISRCVIMKCLRSYRLAAVDAQQRVVSALALFFFCLFFCKKGVCEQTANPANYAPVYKILTTFLKAMFMSHIQSMGVFS